MKHIKKLSIIAVVAILILSTFMLYACNAKENNNDATPIEPQMYTIQYTDDAGVHAITVMTGDVYSLDTIPTRNGYEFLGLYDAETGGTQYVTANGSSVSAFTDNRNLVLYPQFRPKQYTIELNYGEAAVTGSRAIKVNYGQELSELPTDLKVPNKVFKGWYTKPDGEGTQIADAYGLIPSKAKVNENNFDLSDPDGFINLYAAFKGQEFLVTLHIDGVSEPEELMVEYGTHVSKIVTETRNAEGKAVITWSKSSDKKEAFNGRITGETVLYSMEFAPAIDFDSNGGEAVDPIVLKAGSAIKLPTPIRENYYFEGWYTESGEKFTSTIMGENSQRLKAKWYAMLIFNTNGGTPVDNIAQEQGTAVDLSKAVPQKEGFMFAGWYTETGARYTDVAMPSYSIKLFAKYYKTIKEIQLLVSGESYTSLYTSRSRSYSRKVDLSSFFNKGITEVNVKVHYELRLNDSSLSPTHTAMHHMEWYNLDKISELYKVWTYDGKHDDNQYHVYEHEGSLELTASNNIFYVYYYCDSIQYRDVAGGIKDWWLEITYPDMSRLY